MKWSDLAKDELAKAFNGRIAECGFEALRAYIIDVAVSQGVKESDAEDVAQDQISYWIRRWNAVSPPENPEAFVREAVMNRLRMHWRGQKRRATMIGAKSHEPSAEAHHSAHDMAVLREVLDRAPPDIANILVLRAMGWTWDELAKELGTNRDALQKRLARWKGGLGHE